MKSLKRLSAFFMVLSLCLGQLGMIVPAFTCNQAQASANVQSNKATVSQKAGQVGPSESALGTNPKKDSLSGSKKKLGTDLLKLVDATQLLPGETQDQIVSQMKTKKQYVGKTDTVGKQSAKIGAAHGDLVNVYISLDADASAAALDTKDANGAPYVWEVTGMDEENHLAVALVETSKLEALAALPSVKEVRTVTPPKVRKGSVTAEGDEAHKTLDVRNAYAQQGTGVKIGVISDGVDHISQSVSSGDLPSNVTVLDNTDGGDEGTAMLEIIYDMAPGANLYFSSVGNSLVDFNAAIDRLAAAGCKIIVDDIGFYEEAWFEDGIVGVHMASVMASQGIVFVSAAGNEADVHFQGTYYNNGSSSNDFSHGTSSSKYLYATVAPGSDIEAALQWDDKFGESGNDYDLAIYNKSTHTKLASSTSTQDGNDNPYEVAYYVNKTSRSVSVQIEVSNFKAAEAKILEVYLWADYQSVSTTNLVPADSIYGHPNVLGVMAVGAINAQISSWDTAEYWSSEGPSTYLGGEMRAKPDIAGMDGVQVTGVGGFGSLFFGTSAAAPAIGAVVAQLWGAFPTLTGVQIQDAIKASAVDLGTSGFDYIYGNGKADALSAYQLLTAQTDSSAKAITTFTLAGQTGIINEAAHTVAVNLPLGTEVTALAPAITVSDKATINPASGTVTDFTSPVIYTVTAEDGTTQAYVVTVTLAEPKSSAKAISTFTLAGQTGTINEAAHTVTVSLPYGTSVTALAPTITVSDKATVNPASGTSKNFTSPVIYTVTAQDGSKQVYTVTVTLVKSSAKAITSFILKGQAGVIDEANHIIKVSLPSGTRITSLAPTITVSAKATVNPSSGTSKNFTYPVTYTVTAQDGSRQAYTVTVSLVKSSAKAITSFTLKGKIGVINEVNHTITVRLPAGTRVTSLAPYIVVSSKATVSPSSGTYKNFTYPMTYTVTAEDNSKQAYTVTAIVG